MKEPLYNRGNIFFYPKVMLFFAFFVANPDRIFFMIPYIQHPVTWYGLLFASGFLVSYFLVKKIFFQQLKQESFSEVKEVEAKATFLTDRLAFLLVMGTIVGARLGHVFFYDWPVYRKAPLDILKVWEGGLASHGAALGIVLALFLFVRFYTKSYRTITFLGTLDAVVMGAAFAGGMIRVGNFMNQEILGVPTTMPWGVIFMNPLGGPRGVPLHPVQLYEALFYFSLFVMLFFIWKKGIRPIGTGLYTGLFFLLIFTFRFFIEFFKLPLSQLMDETSYITMGQLLSIPFIFLGLFLLFRLLPRKN